MIQIPEILIASTNKGKFFEINRVAEQYDINLITIDVVKERKTASGNSDINIPDVIEHADTYEGNAKLKASGFYNWSGIPCLADDTGLEVEALAGEPGLYSARYAGTKVFQDNIDKLLGKLKGVQNRSAKFVCVIYLQVSPEKYLVSKGELYGKIVSGQRGSGGFGYDSIFYIPKIGKTLAEVTDKLSVDTHRVIACRQLLNN